MLYVLTGQNLLVGEHSYSQILLDLHPVRHKYSVEQHMM